MENQRTALERLREHITYQHGNVIRLQIDKRTFDELVELEKEQIKRAYSDGHEATYNGCESDCSGGMQIDESDETYFASSFNPN